MLTSEVNVTERLSKPTPRIGKRWRHRRSASISTEHISSYLENQPAPEPNIPDSCQPRLNSLLERGDGVISLPHGIRQLLQVCCLLFPGVERGAEARQAPVGVFEAVVTLLDGCWLEMCLGIKIWEWFGDEGRIWWNELKRKILKRIFTLFQYCF